MSALTKIELKKLIQNKAVIIACLLVLLYIFIILAYNICNHGYYIYNEKAKKVERLMGLKAVRGEKQKIQPSTGYLDKVKIRQIIHGYHKTKENKENLTEDGSLSDNAIVKYWSPYSGIRELFAFSYMDIHQYDPNIIDNLSENDAKAFYSNRIGKIKKYLDLYAENGLFDQSDAKAIMKAAKTLKTPIYYKYHEGWNTLLSTFYSLNLVIIFVLCFCNCFIFTNDIQNGIIHIVYPTIYGKKKIAYVKIKVSMIFSCFSLILFNFIFCGAVMIIYGSDGWNCPIQTEGIY
jgi:hypothetical protein